ncbi:MAG: hypothetical protein GYA87_02205 [Christensenellaceae bacterium]|nr:hypothetical protein [Christensenellaceae bacterium]
MTHTKKFISIMLIAVLMLSIIPFGVTEQVENPAPVEQAAPIEEPMPEEAPPSPTEAPAQVEDPPVPTEAPAPTEAPIPTEASAPVVTEIPTEQPAPTEQATPTEEPTPIEQPTQEPLPSPTVQANIVDKSGWEYAPQEVVISPTHHDIGVGNRIEVYLNGEAGGTGKFTYAYYIYNGNTVVQKTSYSKNDVYTYIPKTPGKYHALAFIKNEKGEIRTLKSKKFVNVVNNPNPIEIRVDVFFRNIVLGDVVPFEIISFGGNEQKPHMHAYYVYKDNKVIEKFPYKQSKWYFDNGFYASDVIYKPKSPGKYKYVLFVKDALGNAKTHTTEEFLVMDSPLNLRANLKNKNLNLGEVANVIAEASGGAGNYQYAYYVYKNNTIIERFSYTTNSQFNYTPKSEGMYKVQVFVKDRLGAFKIDTTQEFFVTKAPLRVSISEVFAANLIRCKTCPEGGVAPYKYAYYIYKENTLVEKLPYVNGEGDSIEGYCHQLNYIPKSSGTYRILAFVKDAAGIIKAKSTNNINYNGDLTMYENPQIEDMIHLGNNINVKTYVRSGQGFYKYAYYIYKNDVLLQRLPYTNNSNFAYKPENPGMYKVLVFVKDDTGKIVYGMSNSCYVYVSIGFLFDYVRISEVSLPNSEIEVRARAYDGIEPYQYAYYIYHNNSIIKRTNYSEYAQTYKFTATNLGNYHVMAFVKDATGAIVYGSSNICVVSNNPIPPSSYQGMNVDCDFKKAASTLNIRACVYDGMAPYQYAYYVYKDGVRVKNAAYKAISTNSFSFDYNVTESGTYKVIVFVKDKIGKIQTGTIDNLIFNLSVEPYIGHIAFANNTINLGEEFCLNTEIRNGFGANVAYNVYKDGVLYYKSNFMPCNSFGDAATRWYFKPNHAGSYTVRAILRSANGNVTFANTNYDCVVN